MASWLMYKCADCLDTGAFGPPPGDYCNCAAGKELKELSFKLEHGHYPEEHYPHSDCEDVCGDGDDCFSCKHWIEFYKDKDIELSRCVKCKQMFVAPYGTGICYQCGDTRRESVDIGDLPF